MPPPICCRWRLRRFCPMCRSRTCGRPRPPSPAGPMRWARGAGANPLAPLHPLLRMQSMRPRVSLGMFRSPPPGQRRPTRLTPRCSVRRMMYLQPLCWMSPARRCPRFSRQALARKPLLKFWGMTSSPPLDGGPTARHVPRLRWMSGQCYRPQCLQSSRSRWWNPPRLHAQVIPHWMRAGLYMATGMLRRCPRAR